MESVARTHARDLYLYSPTRAFMTGQTQLYLYLYNCVSQVLCGTETTIQGTAYKKLMDIQECQKR